MKKNSIVMLVGLALSVIAICLIGLPGISQSAEGAEGTIALAGLMFGNGTMNASKGGFSVSMSYKGGLSYFGLLSFIALLVGIVLVAVRVVLSFMKKGDKKILSQVGSVLLVVAGVFAFMIMVAGTDVSMTLEGFTSPSEPYSSLMEGCALGVGTWLYAILAILAGGAVFASDFIKD